MEVRAHEPRRRRGPKRWIRPRRSGPALLLLHGAVCDRRVWRAQVEALSDAYTVIAWDAPGCGESSDPPEHFGCPSSASASSGSSRTRPREAHVLGHSWGTSLALELYRQRPELPGSLILVGAYAGWAGSLSPDEVSRRLAFALATAELGSGEFDPTTMPGLFSDAMPRRQSEGLAEIMREIRPAGTRTMAHALAEADQRAMLPTIAVPTLLLSGDADDRSPFRLPRHSTGDPHREARAAVRARPRVLSRGAGGVQRRDPQVSRVRLVVSPATSRLRQ